MRYLLTVLSSGRPDYLARTLAAFHEHVSPAPADIYVYDDSAPDHALGPVPAVIDAVFSSGLHDGSRPVRSASAESRLGMCAAHARCWQAAAESDLPWVFHLEDDMRVLCPIMLNRLVNVIDEKHLAQMTLMRTPWAGEVEYGGYVQKEPGWYTRCGIEYSGTRWFETTRNWSCAPTLFRTSVARQFDWPAHPGCETEIGPLMLAADPELRFGIWGAGECQVAHIGVERAPGSKGY